jgi:hypothetical protein
MGLVDELIQDLKGISPGRKDLRNFGLTFLVALALMGGYLLWRHKGPEWLPWSLLALAAACGLAGLCRPALLALPYRAWMSLAALIGFFMSRISLAVLFYAVITPIGLRGRLAGKDWLDRKMDGRDSYWHLRPEDDYQPRQTEKMY